MIDGVIERLGSIVILVLNASVRREARFTETSFEQWRVPL